MLLSLMAMTLMGDRDRDGKEQRESGEERVRELGSVCYALALGIAAEF